MAAEQPTLLIRPARESDLAQLILLADSIPDSITSLQPNKKYLKKRINQSLRSFSPLIDEPGPEKYFFVLEDLSNDRIAGTSSIYAKTGGYEPTYTYEIVEKVLKHEPLGIETHIPELHLLIEHEGPSELGGLLLHEDYRGTGMGGALSRCRFLFSRLFPERFTEEIQTEFRGVVTKTGEVPFWEAIGRHFFTRDFFSLDRYSAVARKDFIRDLMPRHPIYIPLLPEKAQQVIGKPHPAAEPAVHVLKKEGFRYINRVDIFDAGPIYRAVLSETVCYQQCQRGTLTRVVESLDAPAVLVSNAKLDFRAAKGPLQVEEDESITLSRPLAERLEVEPGEELLFLPPSKQ